MWRKLYCTLFLRDAWLDGSEEKIIIVLACEKE